MLSIRNPNVSISTGKVDISIPKKSSYSTLMNLVELDYVNFDHLESNGCTFQFTDAGKSWMAKNAHRFTQHTTNQSFGPMFKLSSAEYYSLDGAKPDTSNHPCPMTTGPCEKPTFDQFQQALENITTPIVIAGLLKAQANNLVGDE